MFYRGNFAREIGTAFAVLAIYVLTLLLPLHQEAGLQRDLARLGYDTIGTWSICSPPAQHDDNGGTPTAVKCPAAGIAKNEFTGPLPIGASIEPQSIASPVQYYLAASAAAQALHDHVGQPRAPPVITA